MRVSQEEKTRSHERIVESAARLLRERGVESTGVAEVMGAAGLTHGGFYRHFEDKDALVAAALGSAFAQLTSTLEACFEGRDPAAAVAAFQVHYLSDGHVAQPGIGCPLAALGGEVARGPAALKAAFGAGVERMVTALAAGMPGPEPGRRAAAARKLAMLVGAAVIARASDPATARAVLDACRSTAVGQAPALGD